MMFTIHTTHHLPLKCSSNHIKDVGATALCPSLSALTALQTLNLRLFALLNAPGEARDYGASRGKMLGKEAMCSRWCVCVCWNWASSSVVKRSACHAKVQGSNQAFSPTHDTHSTAVE